MIFNTKCSNGFKHSLDTDSIRKCGNHSGNVKRLEKREGLGSHFGFLKCWADKSKSHHVENK